MGKSSRRVSKGRTGEFPKYQFICAHHPALVAGLKRDTWNEARDDQARHNHYSHNGGRWNDFHLRCLQDDGWQEIRGKFYVPRIVREFDH